MRLFALPFSLTLLLLGATCALAQEKDSGARQRRQSIDVHMDILDLQEALVANERFQAMARMLGVAMEDARTLEEPAKAKVYEKVLSIMKKIKATPGPTGSKKRSSATGSKKRPTASRKPSPTYTPGAARLDIFMTSSLNALPDVAIRSLSWEKDLAINWKGDPNLDLPAGYVGRFSFYFHAEKEGKYGFSFTHNTQLSLAVEGKEVLLSKGVQREAGNAFLGETPFYTQQAVIALKRGYAQMVLLVKGIGGEAIFRRIYTRVHANVMRPGAESDSTAITRNMLFVIKTTPDKAARKK